MPYRSFSSPVPQASPTSSQHPSLIRRIDWRRTSGIAAAIGSALLASVCCIGPMVLLALGVGGVHFIEVLEPYRPFLILLEVAGYLFYKRTVATSCEADSVCATGTGRIVEQVVFWSALLLAVGGIVWMAA